MKKLLALLLVLVMVVALVACGSNGNETEQFSARFRRH